MTKKDVIISIGTIVICMLVVASTKYRMNQMKEEYQLTIDSLKRECDKK